MLIKFLTENSIDCRITDQPYELGFMGKHWDKSGIANDVEFLKEVLKVLKPGAYSQSMLVGKENKMSRRIVQSEREVQIVKDKYSNNPGNEDFVVMGD
jgi:hypothetical protein